MRGLLAPLIKLVVFLLVTTAATYVLAATIANSSFGSTNTYKADFTDAAGLNVGDDVRVAGVRVGTVDDIKVVDEKESRKRVAQVTFTVDKSRPLPKSVDITLRYRNLVGQRYIDIAQGTGDTGTLPAGATVLSSQTHPAVDLTVLFQGFRPLFQGLDADQINSLATELIQTLQGEGGSVELLLSTLADLSNSVADRDQVIGSVVTNLNEVLTTLGDRDTELSNLVVQLQGFISGLAEDRNTIGDAIDGINGLATQTAGLLTNIRAPLARDIKDVTGLVGVLNANSGTIKYVLQQLPGTVGALIRTASYGSWFNFYLCSSTLEIPDKSGAPGTNISPPSSAQPRCH
jgi:phospholipid/cholesterol/gamma-HCH transport system substrate-binding protein